MIRHHLRHVLIGVAGLLLIAALAPTAAAASTATAGTLAPPRTIAGGTLGGPIPQSYPSFDHPAGDPCPFALHGEFPVNHVVGYPYTDAAGRVVAEFYTGALYLTVTRVDTGSRRTINISGSGVQVFNPDGSSVLYGVGPFASTQHPGDQPGPELAILHGISALAIGADGHKTIRYSSRVENVCTELR